MSRQSSRHPSIRQLLGTSGVGKSIALYAFGGPLVGAVGAGILSSLGDTSGVDGRLSAAIIVGLSYVCGILPASATGAYAAITPYGRALWFVGRCMAAGALFSGVQAGIAYLVMAEPPDAASLSFATAIFAVIGAVASLPCTLVLRWQRRGLLRPERLADAFT